MYKIYMPIEEYIISLTEIERRKKSFTTFIISVIAGLTLSSFDLIIANSFFAIIILFTFSMFLFVARILTIKSLNNYSQIKFFLNDYSIERKSIKTKESYFLKDITQLNIKRTTNNYIREIKIILNDRIVLFVNGLNNIEQFKQKLTNKCSSDIRIKEIKEPIDFDHPLFYLFFGLFISCFFTFFIRFIANINFSSLMIVYYLIIIFNLAVSLYLIIIKPVLKRYGKNIKTDYILGFSILFFDIILYLYIT